MSNILTNFIDEVVPADRRAAFHYADQVLTGVGHRTHHLAAENLLSLAEDMTTVDLIDHVENAILNSLVDQITEYGIGIQERELGTLTAIFTGLNAIIDFQDQQGILDITDQDDLPEEIFADILALVYSDDAHRYLNALDYVQPSLIQRIVANASQMVEYVEDTDEVEEPDEEAPIERLEGETGVGEHTRAIVKDFVERHHPERFVGMIQNGARLGYSLATYLNQTLDEESMSVDSIASEYMAAALATGESPTAAVEKASDRLEARLADIHTLQQVLQVLRGYLAEGKTE